MLIGWVCLWVFGAPDARAARLIAACGDIYENVTLQADLRSGGDCLTVKADDVVIDGNGKTITVSGDGSAVNVFERAGVTIKNMKSNAGVQIYGGRANRNRIEKSNIGYVAVYMGDDTTITGNRLTGLAIQGLYDDPAQRASILDNVIEGDANRLVDIMAGGDGTVLCADGDHRIERNRMINHAAAPNPDSPITFYYRCTKHSTIRQNAITATSLAQGIRMRDEADDNLLEENTVWVHESERGALMISSGNVDKDFPSRNTFRRNTFRADDSRALFTQAMGHDNRFERNLFWSRSWEGNRINVGHDNTFISNTFVNEYANRSGERPGALLVLDGDRGDSATFTDNIFAQLGGNMFLYDFDGFDVDAYRGDGNHFWHSDGRYRFGQQTDSLAAWRNESGDDRRSTSGNPRFRNVRQGDFTLLGRSPALQPGTAGLYRGAYGRDEQRCTDQWLRSSHNPAPMITNVRPTTLGTDGGTVRLTGRNLTAGTSAMLDGRTVRLTRRSNRTVDLRIPRLTAGRYDIVLTSPTGRSCRLPNALLLR